jgi:hypothetical protein
MICILHSKGNETQNFSTPTADANEASVRPPRLIGSLLAGRTTPRTGLAVVAARSHQPSHPCSLFRSTSFHSTRISTPGPRETLRHREREIEEAASLARLHGKWALGWSKEEDGDRYLLALAISSMYSRRRRLHSQSSPQYEYDMTLPRIPLDVELALQLQGQGVEREMRAP